MANWVEGEIEVSGEPDGVLRLVLERTKGGEKLIDDYMLTPHKALRLAKKLEAVALVYMAPNVSALPRIRKAGGRKSGSGS